MRLTFSLSRYHNHQSPMTNIRTSESQVGHEVDSECDHAGNMTSEFASSTTTPQAADKRHLGGSEHYTGPPASASTLASAAEPPQTANHATVRNQNRNQFGKCPSQLFPYGRVSSECNPSTLFGESAQAGATVPAPTPGNPAVRLPQLPFYNLVSSEDSQVPQYYSYSSTSAIGLPPTANNATVQNPNPFSDFLSQLIPDGPVSSEDSQRLQHCVGPSTSTYTLTRAIESPQATDNATVENQNQFINCHSHLCLCIQNGNACVESITCGTVPEHFRAMHSIKGLPRDFMILCEWQNCGSKIRRHNFVRHIREKHLGHERR
ncbi:hypothetical protein EDC04DRAFT_3092090 [Pisolithus marmoratus]|nr:hypothetical protein EDC04DRAFT_3092090 [Pisolithus marmoratus]